MTTVDAVRQGFAGSTVAPCCGVTGGVRAAAILHPLVSLCMLFNALPADASMICRWVDESGRTQLAETVPQRYEKSAKCTDSSQFDISPERMQQAQERGRTLRERADNATPPASAASAPAPAAARASAPQSVKRPARGVDQSTDCATWRRLYQESSACFAPYRTVGGTKAEAFEKCTAVPEPASKCGAPAN